MPLKLLDQLDCWKSHHINSLALFMSQSQISSHMVNLIELSQTELQTPLRDGNIRCGVKLIVLSDHGVFHFLSHNDSFS